MIRLQELVKDYGTLRAVDRISFTINDGEILGFLGPNGAGKSTTLKMITCYLSPTAGTIEVGDHNVVDHSQEIRKQIGYLPEQNPLYTEMTVYDYLKFVAEVREIEDFRSAMKRAVEKCGLQGVVNKPINTLSKGYRQRVGLAQAIIHDPKILILDEPTTGLDPNQIVEIRELIKELGKEKTLIISSHILQEVQAVCDRIVIINKGKIVADGSTEELQAGFQNRTKLHLEIDTIADYVVAMAHEIEGLEITDIQTKNNRTQVELEYDAANELRPAIYRYIKEKDWTLWEMHKANVSLEHVFRNLTIEGGAQ
jgi:ABC-2 type transport system ATP-binding protein